MARHTPVEVLRRAGHKHPEQIIEQLRAEGYLTLDLDPDTAIILKELARDAHENEMKSTYAFISDLRMRIIRAIG